MEENQSGSSGEFEEVMASANSFVIKNCNTVTRPFLSQPKGSKGTSLKSVGKTDEGHDILEDSNGKQYYRDSKGTIRRLKVGS